LVVLRAEEPASVRPPEAAERRMRVGVQIGVLVMMAMVRRPPQRALLSRRASDAGEHELKDTTRAVRPVREIAMVSTRDAEHANGVHRRAEADRFPRDTGPERAQTRHVKTEERDTPDPFDAFAVRDRIVPNALGGCLHCRPIPANSNT